MKPTGPSITIARKTGLPAALKRLAGITKLAAYVGVPASTSEERSNQLLGMAAKSRGAKRTRLEKAAASDVNNAELLFLFEHGSPARGQPPRRVLGPAVKADGNRQPIARELATSVKASLDGDRDKAVKCMRRAALAGQNAARGWFTSGRTGWAPLAESTKRGRLSRMSKAQRAEAATLGDAAFTPGVDTGTMRARIQGIVGEE